MKLSHLAAAAGLALLAGCNSLDNPLSDLTIFKTGRDSRVYNPQTGEYEWPDKANKPRPRAERVAAGKPGSVPATPSPASDGRPYDPTKNEFRDPPID